MDTKYLEKTCCDTLLIEGDNLIKNRGEGIYSIRGKNWKRIFNTNI